MRDATYIQFQDDVLLDANGDGSAKTHILTPKAYWSLGLGLNAFIACLNVTELAPNCGVTVKWQWSVDGVNWNTGATVITEKTAMGSYTGSQTSRTELTPYCRIVLEVRDTVGTVQVTARLSAWGHYWYQT